MQGKNDASWERSLDAQAMEVELYFIGKRAGTMAATAEWPRVAVSRPDVVTKSVQATRALFGRDGAARNSGYSAGWVDGYLLSCRERKQQHR
jgi:hypothetical protein